MQSKSKTVITNIVDSTSGIERKSKILELDEKNCQLIRAKILDGEKI